MDIYKDNKTYRRLFDQFHSTRYTHTVCLEPDLVADILKLMNELWKEAGYSP